MPHLRVLTVLLIAVVSLGLSGPAYAYIDPGSASMILTAVLSLSATVAFLLRRYIYRFMSLFKRSRKVDRTAVEGDAVEGDAVEGDED